MDRDAQTMFKRLVEQWDQAKGTLERLAQGATVRPDDGPAFIRFVETPATPEIARFEMAPVVFNVPERANDTSSMLFVVAFGWLALNREAFKKDKTLVTHSFSTRTAYFRWDGKHLNHVYGAHHDVAVDELGHPTFHSQMRSYPELHQNIAKEFGIDSPCKDQISAVLRNVRLPTAQMDFFSFILQVFADHLLIKSSTPEEKGAFNSLLQYSLALKGAASRSDRLTADIARSCYRAMHWYPVVE
jgi:hypothetical protein